MDFEKHFCFVLIRPLDEKLLESQFVRCNDIQHNDTQHKGLICDTQHKWHSALMTLSIITLCIECNYAECRYAECHYAQWYDDTQHNDTQNKGLNCDIA